MSSAQLSPAASPAETPVHAAETPVATVDVLGPVTRAFYCHAMDAMNAANVPFLVGGAYAFARYTGIERHTKDFDVFVRPADAQRALDALTEAGYHAEMTYPHWLGKAFSGEDFVDVIFSAGNGVARVDDVWFQRAVDGEVLGKPVKLVPPEEMLWSKAFIQERERFDGADVAHVLRACAATMDWDHLLERFGDNWRVLFGHLVIFGFIYPDQRALLPVDVMRKLTHRLEAELQEPCQDGVCGGTLLSRAQYLTDVDVWGYDDARLQPRGAMSEADIAHWTAAMQNQ
jgi:hypothetical protein